jgi:hypothetical protein
LAVAKVFTRQQFYDLVWSKPMTHIANDFALSDVALHKICKKNDIPTPPVGWWAKKVAGKPVKQSSLPKPKIGSVDKIVIVEGDLSLRTGALAAVREEARIIASNVEVAEIAPHPIVTRTVAKLRKAAPIENGNVTVEGPGLIKCEVNPQSIERLERVLNQIVRAASVQGFRLVGSGAEAHFESSEETVGFSMSESVRRKKHELTENESAQLADHLRKQQRLYPNQSWRWRFSGPSFPEWDWIPTGQLTIAFEDMYIIGRPPRRSFRDAKIQRLENMASDIAVGLKVFAAAKTEERLRTQRHEQLMEELRQSKERAARTKHIEERRVSATTEILTQVQNVDLLKRLIGMLIESAPSEPPPRVGAFLEWAKHDLAKREASLGASELEKWFERHQLFGDTDEYSYKPQRDF